MNNARVTLYRPGETYNQTTGRRTTGTPVAVLVDERCMLSQSKTNRVTYSDGMHQIVKPGYSLLIETYEEINVEPGYTAVVTMRGASVSQSYTITDAILSVGIRRKAWKCDIERLKQ